jgi:hypothetical protein
MTKPQDGSATAATAARGETIEEIYDRYAPQVERWVRRLAGPRLDVEDLLHDIFLVVLRRRHEFRGEAKITTWLFCITWANAQSICSSLGGGFRLPTLKELDALVTTGLVLDRTIFQPTACSYSWTSSPYGGPDASETGTARYSPAFNMQNWSTVRYGWGVRCVR